MAQRVTVENEVCVVGDVAARRAKVDDASGAGRHLAEAVDVRHDVVAQLLFLCGDHVIVDRADVRRQLLDLRLRDGQAERVLRTGKAHPQPAPRFKAHVRRKQMQHVLGGIARAKRAFICGLHEKTSYL